jgi:dihydrofolate reductase
MRKIIVSIATSADGFIARRDGSIDWLNDPRFKGDYGMSAFMKSVDTIVYGRKTFDLVMKLGGLAMFGAGTKHIMFSRKPRVARENVEFVRTPVADFARKLRKKQGKDIWLMGGGDIIGAFLEAGAIDEFVIHVIPVFIGEGVPLIKRRNLAVPLTLLSTRKYADGVVGHHYAVERPKIRRSRG